MGCDGGTIPKRHELVRMKKKPEQKDKDMERTAKWSRCAISQEELKQPIVACELGCLYNKEAVIEVLLEKIASSCTGHIRSLKDVKELKLTKNTEFDNRAGELADKYHDTLASEFICPVVGIEMNGRYKFCLLWKCGCVMSERALKEVPSATCHKCGEAFDEADVVYLNSEGDDLEKMKEKMQARRLATKQAKKAKKDKKSTEKVVSTEECSSKSVTNTKESNGKHEATITNGLKRPSQSLKDGPSQSKKGKIDNKLVNGHADKNGSKFETSKPATSKQTDVTVDPSKRSVYKNLFTSSEKAKGRGEDKKAHWVTYNPYHL